MIVYTATRGEFDAGVRNDQITGDIYARFRERIGQNTSQSEIESWTNSLPSINNALHVGNIPEDSTVAIEYQIPRTKKRVDFLVAGVDNDGFDSIACVELKQWQSVKKSEMHGMVKTHLGGTERIVPHPSRQAFSYAAFIQDFNVAVQESNIELHACAYLHNCHTDAVIKDESYREYLELAPSFLADDEEKLGHFLGNCVSRVSERDLIGEIDASELRPSKDIAACMDRLLKGNREFTLLDEQIHAFEAVRKASRTDTKKQVVIVEGGPGTGKSVIAVNVLNALIADRKNSVYVTRNTAPRKVFQRRLSGRHPISQDRLKALFQPSGKFWRSPSNDTDVILVDEAHRLNYKSGHVGQFGENQVKEIVNAGKCSVFFLDEDQNIHWKDIGSRHEITQWADHFGAEITNVKLDTQFRCNGSDGYLDWLEDVLHSREIDSTLNMDFDFRVFDDPHDLYDAIRRKNEPNDRSRLVAGYCWEWKDKKLKHQIRDVTIPEFGFSMFWNLHESDADSASYWSMRKGSIDEVGCINTCQGLELDYVGVIVGKDLIMRDNYLMTDATARAKDDSTVRGYKTAMKDDPQATLERLDKIIRNTYRTLMSRGTKGCYVFCVDNETNEYFKSVSRDRFSV